jgi:hypothetical protein
MFVFRRRSGKMLPDGEPIIYFKTGAGEGVPTKSLANRFEALFPGMARA